MTDVNIGAEPANDSWVDRVVIRNAANEIIATINVPYFHMILSWREMVRSRPAPSVSGRFRCHCPKEIVVQAS
jgi:hypothetical protein